MRKHVFTKTRSGALLFQGYAMDSGLRAYAMTPEQASATRAARAWWVVEAEDAAQARRLIELEQIGAGELFETREGLPGPPEAPVARILGSWPR